MIRTTTAHDHAALSILYSSAFPGEDLLPLLESLLSLPEVLSLAAYEQDSLVGHVLITACGITTEDPSDGPRPGWAGALLGPLAVRPQAQGRGVGSGLVRAGAERLASTPGSGGPGMSQLFVLGDPGYYGRFGFAPERRVAPPYPLPRAWVDAWQSLALDPGGAPSVSPPHGTLTLPAPWNDAALWGA